METIWEMAPRVTMSPPTLSMMPVAPEAMAELAAAEVMVLLTKDAKVSGTSVRRVAVWCAASRLQWGCCMVSMVCAISASVGVRPSAEAERQRRAAASTEGSSAPEVLLRHASNCARVRYSSDDPATGVKRVAAQRESSLSARQLLRMRS